MIDSNWKNFYSLKKWQTFRRCEREYYLNYNYAFGGHDADSPKLIRQVHFLKQLLEKSVFKTAILRQSLLQLLHNNGELKQLPQVVIKRFFRYRHYMLNGDCFRDHKYMNLREFYYQSQPPGELFKSIFNELKLNAENLSRSDYLRFLWRLDRTQIQSLTQVPEIKIGDLMLYGGTFLAANFNLQWHLIGFEPENQEDIQYYSLFNLYYGQENFRVDITKIKSSFINPWSGNVNIIQPDTVEISSTLEDIRRNCGLLPRFTEKETPLYQMIPGANLQCENCRFYAVCKEKNSFF